MSVDEANQHLESVEATAREFTDAVDNVKKRSDAIHSYNQQSILDDIQKVKESTSGIQEVEKELEKVGDRTDRQNDQIQNIRRELNALKERINEARELASKVSKIFRKNFIIYLFLQIKIAVKSDAGANCVLEYVSPLAPTAANIIEIKYRPAMDSPDSLIFFTQTTGTRTVIFQKLYY